MPFNSAIENSIQYLNSEQAAQSIKLNAYWPKWNSPWWHMSLLFEMGLVDRIPKKTAALMLSEIKRTHLPYFFREEAPLDKADFQEAPCPCSLGNIYQILSATGLDVDAELPWARGWFLKYQMPDGGLSCDEDAYKADAKASSLVGTIAPLEAILKTRNEFTAEEAQFLDRGAECLLHRELRLGSPSQHNVEERLDEVDWLKLCFPRFYLYDVLRGLSFVLAWSEKRRQPIRQQSIAHVVTHLTKEFEASGPEQIRQMKMKRQSYEGVFDRKRHPASYFQLLNETSVIGQPSPFLTKQWLEAVALMGKLKAKGLLS